jgi:hypothetical protein
MILVHGESAETALPEMAGAPAPRMNNAGNVMFASALPANWPATVTTAPVALLTIRRSFPPFGLSNVTSVEAMSVITSRALPALEIVSFPPVEA